MKQLTRVDFETMDSIKVGMKVYYIYRKLQRSARVILAVSLRSDGSEVWSIIIQDDDFLPVVAPVNSYINAQKLFDMFTKAII